MSEPVRILAIAAVRWAAARLDIGRAPRTLTQRAQGRRRVEGAGAHLKVIGLKDHTALCRPEILKAQDDFLKTGRFIGHL